MSKKLSLKKFNVLLFTLIILCILYCFFNEICKDILLEKNQTVTNTLINLNNNESNTKIDTQNSVAITESEATDIFMNFLKNNNIDLSNTYVIVYEYEFEYLFRYHDKSNSNNYKSIYINKFNGDIRGTFSIINFNNIA